MIVSKCPICGRYPIRKIYPFLTHIECKPISSKKPHLLVVDDSLHVAMEKWNNACDKFKNAMNLNKEKLS